jgi:hypothetical protein
MFGSVGCFICCHGGVTVNEIRVLNLWPHIRMGFLFPKLKIEFGTQFVRKGGWWEQSL